MEHFSLVEQQLLALLRLAIGSAISPHVVDRLFSSDTDWQSIYDLAKVHAVLPLAYDGIEKLPKEKLPERKLQLRWLGVYIQQKQKNDFNNKVLNEFTGILHSEDINYAVFKGLAVSSMYPNSAIRTIGDIDFYVPKKDFTKCVNLIEKNLHVKIEKSKIDKHYAFSWKGIRFEMHFKVETFGSKKYQTYFDQLIDDSFGKKQSTFSYNGIKVNMFPPIEDLILVFKHWFNHLLGEGVGLRQLTDLAILLRNYENNINIDTLRLHLKNIGYENAFDTLLTLVEIYYAISCKKYNAINSSLSENKRLVYAEKLMKDILKNGNFGKNDYKHHQGWKKRLETIVRFSKHCFRYFPLAPMDIAWTIPRRISISIKSH